jgi:hypothetical protein
LLFPYGDAGCAVARSQASARNWKLKTPAERRVV